MRHFLPILLFFTATLHASDLGVSLSGAEFAGEKLPGIPGKDYTFNSAASYQYFSAKGIALIRLPILWERIQPVLNGPLDPAYLALVKASISWAAAAQCNIILDVHNYARYSIVESGTPHPYIIDNVYAGVVKVPATSLANLWTRLSVEFKDVPTIHAYGLMNEPHDMGTANWAAISQAALCAIRTRGDNKLIFVSGDGWSGAGEWAENNGSTSWITDPAKNFKYEAHEYFDHDNSGTYVWNYDQELAKNPALPGIGKARLSKFVEWCQLNHIGGFVGEFGAPGKDPRWLAVLDNFLSALDAAKMGGTYWTAGEWYGNYALCVQPADNFKTDAPQLAPLLKHLAALPASPRSPR